MTGVFHKVLFDDFIEYIKKSKIMENKIMDASEIKQTTEQDIKEIVLNAITQARIYHTYTKDDRDIDEVIAETVVRFLKRNDII